MNYITITNLEKQLDGKPILRGVNLSVKKGEIMAVVGPSGSGKSTLLRCINRLIEPDTGIIIVNNKDIREWPPVDLRRDVILVHQETAMLPGSVFDNVSFGPHLKGKVDKNHIIKCTQDTGLSIDFLEKNAEKLSGGEKKRVSLARALALKPNVLLLDEPTSGIDPKNVQMVEKNIVSFSRNRKLTVVWITHHVEQAKRVSDRIANLKGGWVRDIQKTNDFVWEGAY